MPEIFKYLTEDKLATFVRQYSELLQTPVLFLDEKEELLLRFPEDAPQAGLKTRGLSVKDDLVGYIAVPSTTKSAEASLDFMERNLTEVCDMSYEIDSLAGEVARNYEELSLLWQLTSRLGVGLDVDKICKVLADEVMKICPASNISILLLAETSTQSMKDSCLIAPQGQQPEPAQETKPFFFPKVSLGEDASNASLMALSANRGLMGEVYKRKEPITICDVSKDRRFEGFTYPVTRVLVVPLIVEEEVIGAIVASDKLDGEEFYSTEIKLIMSIATECAVSIKKALLYDEIHDMLFSTAEALSLAMDAKDPYTYGHSKRVSQLSASVAKSLGLPAETISRIRLAALLHDIGKLGTPEVILGKDSSLEPEEMELMKEHPYVGARMLENIRRMREIATWMCHHHEKYDGSGYPSGLKGEHIPLPSRIIALADYYDALTSDRPYRKALSKEEAINIMKESVGTHFDPVVYEHLVKVIT
jgi:putative nucleotidyltransferase with HDIG domain